jgi:hypothetical protein
VLLALEFTDDVDPTALATVALALVTLGTLLLLLKSLAYTRRALQQTREDVDLSRREVEEAHRPVVVPVIDSTRRLRPDHPDSPSTLPQVVVHGVIWVPIENIGSGPALSIEASLDLAAAGLVRAVGDEGMSGAITGLGVNHRLPVEFPADGLGTVPDFEITIAYRDVAGRLWQTRARYMAGQHRYYDISVASAGR